MTVWGENWSWKAELLGLIGGGGSLTLGREGLPGGGAHMRLKKKVWLPRSLARDFPLEVLQ